MNLHTLKPRPGAKHRVKRLGNGESSGHGKTCGKGHKGQKARSGGSIRLGFEGGQMPLVRRLPKRGFNNKAFKTVVAIVNVADLNRFESGVVIDEATLLMANLIRGNYEIVKLLGNGELKRKLTVRVDRASETAIAKVQQAGGVIHLGGSPEAAGQRPATAPSASSHQASQERAVPSAIRHFFDCAPAERPARLAAVKDFLAARAAEHRVAEELPEKPELTHSILPLICSDDAQVKRDAAWCLYLLHQDGLSPEQTLRHLFRELRIDFFMHMRCAEDSPRVGVPLVVEVELLDHLHGALEGKDLTLDRSHAGKDSAKYRLVAHSPDMPRKGPRTVLLEWPIGAKSIRASFEFQPSKAGPAVIHTDVIQGVDLVSSNSISLTVA